MQLLRSSHSPIPLSPPLLLGLLLLQQPSLAAEVLPRAVAGVGLLAVGMAALPPPLPAPTAQAAQQELPSDLPSLHLANWIAQLM